jgi:hypothetical protein
MDWNNTPATEIKIEDTGEKALEAIQEEPVKSPSPEQKPKEEKEQKITKCPEDVPTAIFDCLANMTECDRLKLTKDEAQRMSEAITNLFGKYLGGWVWWVLVLVVLILSKLSYAWHCLTKKKDKDKKEQKKEGAKETVKSPTEKPEPVTQETEEKDLVEVVLNGRAARINRQEAIEKGLIKAAEA